MSQFTGSRTSRKAIAKPKKPYPKYPLSPHPSGKWQKKILGRICYFGSWARRVNGRLERVEGDGWKEALADYENQAKYLHAGEPVPEHPEQSEGLTVLELCNAFLESKQRKVDSGEIGLRMFQDYKEIKNLLLATFGGTGLVQTLKPADFANLRAEMAKKWGPTRLGNAITRVKSFFKHAADNELIDKPVKYGPEFRKPDKSVLRKNRAKQPKKMIEAAELRTIINAADPALKAMILLGLNAGLGNNDCATLPFNALNLKTGWIDFPRAKTGIERRAPLWPETIQAIQEAKSVRPNPARHTEEELVFLSERGTAMVRPVGSSRVDLVTIQFAKLVKTLKLHRPGLGFYTLRHVFRTIADAVRDPVAIDLIMGHTDASMANHYRERIEDEDARLRAVTNHVRSWLFVEGITVGGVA